MGLGSLEFERGKLVTVLSSKRSERAIRNFFMGVMLKYHKRSALKSLGVAEKDLPLIFNHRTQHALVFSRCGDNQVWSKMLDLGSSAKRREGSNPSPRTYALFDLPASLR